MTPKKVKPETEIKNLKREVKDLQMLCEMAGMPLLIIHFPQLAFNKGKPINYSVKQTNHIKKFCQTANRKLKKELSLL